LRQKRIIADRTAVRVSPISIHCRKPYAAAIKGGSDAGCIVSSASARCTSPS
jgi:hypothetical protein